MAEEDIKNEEWKDIKGYEGYYQISNFGRVKSFHRSVKGRLRKPVMDSVGFDKVMLALYKEQRNFAVHRLVALHFIPNPENKSSITHIDGNPNNNHVSNLEWCSHKGQTTAKLPKKIKLRRKKNKNKVRERNKKYYKQNKDSILTQQKEFYKQNRDNILTQQKEYYEKNKDKIAEKAKEYYEKNRDNILTQQKEYYEKNRDNILTQQKEYQEKNRDKINEKKKEYYEKQKENKNGNT